jgi:hypothetical protein
MSFLSRNLGFSLVSVDSVPDFLTNQTPDIWLYIISILGGEPGENFQPKITAQKYSRRWIEDREI